jgi:hypothetical protein
MKIAIVFSFVLAAAEARFYLPYLNVATALKAPKATLPQGSVQENTAPFDVPAGYSYRKITDRVTLTNTTTAFPPGFSDWDMVTYAAPENTIPGLYPDAGKFIFIPFESSAGGLLRYNTDDGSIVILAQSVPTVPRNLNPSTFNVNSDNFTRIDPATFTPFNTVLFAEEIDGK